MNVQEVASRHPTGQSPAPDSEFRAGGLALQIVGAQEIGQYLDPWGQLASRALTPNPFFEPWMLLPAVEYLAGSRDLHFLLVFGPARLRTGERDLLGFFPLEVSKTCLHLPIRTLSFWQHRHCFLAVPLIDRDHAWAVLDAFWRWWESAPFGCHVLDTNLLPAEGKFHEIWSDFAIGRTWCLLNEYPRAAMHPSGDAETYTSAAISKKHLQEYARLERKLRQMGACEYGEVTSQAELDAFVDTFLRIEARGWKGAAGSAMGQGEADASYFRDMTRNGFARNRVMLLTLSVNGAPVALKHNVMSGRNGFAFKITFDEAHAKHSPGVLLELENIRRVFSEGRLDWMDSCALPRHPMANRLWSERRLIRRSLYSDASRKGDLIVASIPLVRTVRDRMRVRDVPRHLRISTKSKD